MAVYRDAQAHQWWRRHDRAGALAVPVRWDGAGGCIPAGQYVLVCGPQHCLEQLISTLHGTLGLYSTTRRLKTYSAAVVLSGEQQEEAGTGCGGRGAAGQGNHNCGAFAISRQSGICRSGRERVCGAVRIVGEVPRGAEGAARRGGYAGLARACPIGGCWPRLGQHQGRRDAFRPARAARAA
jgi:hypothetical protein